MAQHKLLVAAASQLTCAAVCSAQAAAGFADASWGLAAHTLERNQQSTHSADPE